jgi:hypothetical protein
MSVGVMRQRNPSDQKFQTKSSSNAVSFDNYQSMLSATGTASEVGGPLFTACAIVSILSVLGARRAASCCPTGGVVCSHHSSGRFLTGVDAYQ